jgi:tripartite-type tricarboxylate transporter receptor subunit TctC
MKIKLLVISLMIGLTSAHAQEWPQKQVKVIIAGTPGSVLDNISRTVFDQVSKQTGKIFTMENKAGAGGTIASTTVAKSLSDGHTLLVNTVTHTVVPSAYKNLPYNVEEDFTNISGLISQPFAVATSLKWKTVGEIVKYGKENPGKLNYGIPGVGSSGHLFMEKFAHSANFKMQNIPFRGSPEAMVELMAGRIDIFPAPVSQALSFQKDGRVNIVAVTSPKRSVIVPDVPTMSESGVLGATYLYWIGVFGPSKMDMKQVLIINSEIQRALSSSEVKSKLNDLGITDTFKMSPNEFDTFVRSEIKHNAEIVTRSKITLE